MSDPAGGISNARLRFVLLALVVITAVAGSAYFGDPLGIRARRLDEALERDGAFYLFTLRLVPALPFFVINLVMGLSALRASTFWWGSQLGMLPGTALYVSAGSVVPDLRTLSEQGAGRGPGRPGSRSPSSIGDIQ